MTEDEAALEAAEEEVNRAMESNDVARIRACITGDWVLVTPERGPVPGEEILALIGQRVLGHTTMTKQTRMIRVWDDVAVVVGRGANAGWFRGAPIQADEWVCDLYRRVEGVWRCELTQLTPARGPAGVAQRDG